MTFLELCQMVIDEGDQSSTLIDGVELEDDMDEMERKVILWVQKAYRKIQRKSQHWRFHHHSDVLFETLADGTKDYEIENVREILPDSIRARVKGETAEYWLTYLTYKDWRERFQVNDLAAGNPIWFIELPNEKIRLEAGPNKVYEILCDWYSTLDKLEKKGDTPIWHEDYHDLIVWEALKDYAQEYEASDTLGKRVSATLPELWNAFERKYLPTIQIGGYFA